MNTSAFFPPRYPGSHEDEDGQHPAAPPQDYVEGPLPQISDSFFSLIILIYVSVIFILMFFSFCWKEPRPPPPDPAHKNIPMITSMLEEIMGIFLWAGSGGGGRGSFQQKEKNMRMKMTLT